MPTHVPEPAEGALGEAWRWLADDMEMGYVRASEFHLGSTQAEADQALDLCNQYDDACERR